ncbi:MAG: hypothetical protein SFW09_02465 [Hyphomicrobiaceae bacterium]|nr:hypothetical protein [Hyphomicrobiaceae bacterium]
MAKPEKKVGASPRARRSKIETQREFEELQAEIAAREPIDAKVEASARAQEDQLRSATAEVGVDAVVQRIAGLGLEVSRALSDIAEKLTAEVRLLGSLKEAAEIERRELDRLHNIDIAATSIDLLVAEHAEKKKAVEAEMAEQRAQWQDETARTERERREQEEALKRQRQREIEDYEYRKALERKKAQDKYDEEQRQAERKRAERQEALEKDWQRREAALKEREEHVARLEAQVAELPARLARETEAAAQEARRQVEAQLERQILLLKKDAEAEARLAGQSIKALEQQLAASAGQIAALEKQLAEAKQQVQDIAVRAIEGASGARALSHINQIAMEQAKNRPQG